MNFAKFVVFTFFSSIEYSAILIFIFTLFRINFRWFTYHIIFVCVSLSYLSFTMREDQLAAISPFVQMAVLIVFMWLLFRIHLGYAAFISTIGYFGYGLLQGLIILIIRLFIDKLDPFTAHAQLVAVITSTITFLLSYYIKRRNLGFSFVPHHDKIEFSDIKKDNLILFIVIFFLLIGVGISYYFTVKVGSTLTFLIVFIVLLLIEVVILLAFSNIKEKQEVNSEDD